MSAPEVHTYYDAVEAVKIVATIYGGIPTAGVYRAVQAAYRRFPQEHDWSCLVADGRIRLQAAVTDGTVAYDRTGGATCERQLTLTPDDAEVWAEDIQDWAIQVDDIVCEVERRHSDTVIQLDAVMCPPADIAAETSYTAFQRWYPLPNDFQAMINPMEESELIGRYVSPARMEQLQRYRFSTGDIYYYTIRSAPGLLGTMALYVHGATTTTETYDFTYRRRLRPLRYHGNNADVDYPGTIAVTADSTAVTGTSTAFDTNNHPGSIILIGDASNVPTGWEGSYPYVEKRSIRAVASTTALTLDEVIVTSNATAKYRITDPIDLPPELYEAFLDCCYAEYGKLARLEERKELEAAFQASVQRAKAADCRVEQVRVVGGPRRIPTRLTQGTIGPVDW